MKQLIDPRVHHVGTSALRTIDMADLKPDELFVIRKADEPLAVVVPYALYMQMQDARTDREQYIQGIEKTIVDAEEAGHELGYGRCTWYLADLIRDLGNKLKSSPQGEAAKEPE